MAKCFLQFLFVSLLATSSALGGALHIDLDSVAPGIQDSVSIAPGGTVFGSIIFVGDGTSASQFDNFAAGLSHAGLTLLGSYQAGDVAGDTVAALDAFGLGSSTVAAGDALLLGPGNEAGLFSNDAGGLLTPFAPVGGGFYGTVELLRFQLTGSIASTVTVSFDDLFTVMSQTDALGNTNELSNDLFGGSVTIVGNDVIPEPASLAVWSLGGVLGICLMRRRRRK